MEIKSSKLRVKRFSLEESEELVREHELSGLSAKDFCLERKVNLRTFYNLRARVVKRHQESSPFIKLQELPSSEPQITLLVSGYELKFSVGALKAVLSTLREE